MNRARYALAVVGWAVFSFYLVTQGGCAAVAEHMPEAAKTPGAVAVKAKMVSDLSCVTYRACRDLDQCPDEKEANEACLDAPPLDPSDFE